jgi:NAD(P)-dependent dehydrogenase (short-subunit alcohol dehydrogenase family)
MTEKERNVSLNSDSVILITGGAKGITAQCAVRLAETAQCKFILAGRSALSSEEPAWAAGVNTHDELQKSAIAFFNEKGEKATPKELQRLIAGVLSHREILGTLDAIQSFGGEAVYISADVTDEKVLAKEIQAAEKKLGSVTGVIHGAGNLADKLIENKTGNDFDLVVNTKVKGLRSVNASIDLQKLEFLVLFSSVAGFFGNAGQADYALANEVLNKSAHILRKSLPNCRVISINWGPWDAGMVSPQLKKYFESRNIPLIQTEDGVQTLINEITGKGDSMTQVVVGSPNFGQQEININDERPVVIHRTITLDENPFALDHKIGPNPVLPATCASSWLVNACESAFPGWHFTRMEDFKVLKGITFSNDPQDYEMKLEKTQSNSGEQLIGAVVTSRNEKGRRIFHYSGNVILSKKLPEAPVFPTPDFEKLDMKDGRIFYEDGTLFHGPLFQGIQKVAFDGDEKVITRIMLPPMSYQGQGQFPVGSVNPYINDAVVQSLLIWSQEVYSAPCLPSRLREWVQYRPIPFGVPIWAVLNVAYHNEHAVTGDLIVAGEDGREYFRFNGLEGTISQQLNRYIGKKAQSTQPG